MTTVTHIVPLFAPVIDGVGDYALNLARVLRAEHSIDSCFVVCDPSWIGPSIVEDFAVHGPQHFGDRGLGGALHGVSLIVLHYVGYAFHSKGIPRWLIETLTKWQRNDANGVLITVFHEIWTSAPPWKSAFFLAPIQRRLVTNLLKLSSHSFVSTRTAFGSLDKITPGKVTLLPVSATIQPSHEPAPHPRGSELFQPLIFGQEWTRKNAVQKHEPLLRVFEREGKLERVLVMGKGARMNPPSEDITMLQAILPDERISVLGEKSVDEAAEVFDGADFLLCPTPVRDLCKSSSVMSAFACGCPVVVPPSSNGDSPDPLQPHHFIRITDSDCDLRNLDSFELRKWNLQLVAAQARSWFLENAAWTVIAAKIAQPIQKAAKRPTSAKT